MKVLYVNHTGQISGAEHSLLDLLRGLPSDVSPLLACPDGPLQVAARAEGVPVVSLPGTDGSLRLHPLHTPVALAEIAWAAASLRRKSSAAGVDLVHANSIRAGLAAGLSRRLRGPPTIVHVRDCLPNSAMSRLTTEVIGRTATLLITNSRYTRDRLDGGAARARSHVVYNPIDVERFDPARISRDAARRQLHLPTDAFVLGMVGQITPWKGQLDAVKVILDIAADHPKVMLVLAGSTKFVSRATRYDNAAYLRQIRDLLETTGLSDRVWFLGERDDVPVVLRALDALLMPSWEEPFGRSAAEAMAMGVTVIATTVGGVAEVIRDGEDGLLAPPRDIAQWAQAVNELILHPERSRIMGERGRVRVRERFAREAHVSGVLRVYDEALRADAA